MATVTVQYLLKLGGDLAGRLPSLATGLRAVGSAAKGTATNIVAIGAASRAGLNAAGEQAKQASEGAFKAAAGFAALGFATHQLLRHNDEYEQSIARLGISAQQLGVKISDALGPRVADVVNRFTIGFTYISNLMVGTTGPAIEALTKLLDKFIERAKLSLEIWKRIGTGDFAGAKDLLKGHIDAAGEMVGIVQDAFKQINSANDSAIQAAFAAWKRQVDGIKDVYTSLDEQAKAAEKRMADMRSAGTTVIAGQSARQAGAEAKSAAYNAAGTQVIAGQSARQLENSERTANELEKTTAAIEGVSMGVSGILGMIPVYGQFLAGIWTFVSKMAEISVNIVNEITNFVISLPEQFATIIEDIPQMLLEAMPEMVTALAKLIPQIILSLISSGPQVFAALLDALMELPKLFVEGFRDMFKEFWQDIKEAIAKITGVFSDKEGHFLGTNFREQGGRKELFGINIPKRHDGGPVFESGLHNLQRGEYVLSRQQMQRGGAGGPVTINMNVAGHNTDQLIRAIRTRLGTYGTGQSLDPFGSR